MKEKNYVKKTPHQPKMGGENEKKGELMVRTLLEKAEERGRGAQRAQMRRTGTAKSARDAVTSRGGGRISRATNHFGERGGTGSPKEKRSSTGLEKNCGNCLVR